MLPEIGRRRYAGSIVKVDGVFGAAGAADTAAVAPQVVNEDLLIGGAVSYSSEMSDPHALPAAVA